RLERGDNRQVAAFHSGQRHARFAQHRTHVVAQRVIAGGQGTTHVDLQEEVHAAAKVEAQVHGVGADRGQPVRRGRQQVQRNRVGGVVRLGVQAAFDKVLGTQLHVGVVEAHAYGTCGPIL